MNSGYGKIFWGIVFATFHINLGSFELLPTFIGFMLIQKGINEINIDKKYEYLTKATRFCEILITASIIAFFDKLFIGRFFDNTVVFIIWITLFSICEMVLFYNLIKSSAEKLAEYNDDYMSCEYNKNVKIYIIVETILVVINNLALTIGNEVLLTIGVFMGLIIRVWMLILFLKLKKYEELAE